MVSTLSKINTSQIVKTNSRASALESNILYHESKHLSRRLYIPFLFLKFMLWKIGKVKPSQMQIKGQNKKHTLFE
jgi:hypothetical protein